jgi:predicted nucleic acid-binding protein
MLASRDPKRVTHTRWTPQARKRSTRVDAMIAATAIVADAALATNNATDFLPFRDSGLRLA